MFRTRRTLSFCSSICSEQEEKIVKNTKDETKLLVDFCSDPIGLELLFDYVNYTKSKPHVPFIFTYSKFSGIRGCGPSKWIILLNSASRRFELYGCDLDKKTRHVTSVMSDIFYRSLRNCSDNQIIDKKLQGKLMDCSDVPAFANACLAYRRILTSLDHLFYIIFVIHVGLYGFLGLFYNSLQSQDDLDVWTLSLDNTNSEVK